MPTKKPPQGKFDPFADGLGQENPEKKHSDHSDEGIFSAQMVRELSERQEGGAKGPIDKRMRTRQILFFLVLVLLICALGGVVVAAWYIRNHDGEAKPAHKASKKTEAPAARPSFAEGAHLGKIIDFPRGFAPLSIQVAPDEGDVFVLAASSDSKGFHQYLFTNNLLKPTKWDQRELDDVSGFQIFDHPTGRLCSIARKAKCPVNENTHYQKVPVDDTRTFDFSRKDSYWHLGDKSYDTNLVFGLLDKNMFLGAQHSDALIGLSPANSTPVDQVTAYSIDSTKPIWTLKLAGMSLVAAHQKYAAVISCDNLDFDRDSLWKDGPAMSQKQVKKFLSQNNRCQVQEIVPATGEAIKSTLPDKTDKTDYAQILKADLGSRAWTVPNNTETGTEAKLKDGKLFIENVPEGVDSSGYDLSKPVWSYGGTDFSDDGKNSPIIYGDVNGDGYIDALAAITHSDEYRKSQDWNTYVYVWLWDPQKNEPVQYVKPLVVSARCGDQYSKFKFTDVGEVTVTEKAWQPTDTCEAGPSTTEPVDFRFNPKEKRLDKVR